jgi:hypothetical protein
MDGNLKETQQEARTHKSSRGRCLCQTLDAQKQCAGYLPADQPWQPEMCAFIDCWDGFSCLRG